MNIIILQDTLYVVLDTNVLLSHLKLISELKDFPIEGKLAGCMYMYRYSVYNATISIQILL